MYDINKLTDRKRNMIFINLLISCIASSMLATALTTALLALSKDLNISIATGQWLTSGYSLVMGIVMPLTAFLITRFPAKKLYLSGIGCFIAGLAVSSIAVSFPVMMAGRILQACGNGILMAMAQVVILTIYPIEKRGAMMGWYGLAAGAAPVIAPTIAGMLVDSVGWRSIFYIVLVIMALSFITAIIVFDDILETEDKKFDIISFIFSIFAFGGITLGIGNIGSSESGIGVIIPLAVGLITSVYFVYRQLRLKEPFLDVRIFKNREYALSVTGSMLLYLVMMGSSVIMPLYVQSVMGYSATVSGLVTLPGSLSMAIISPLAGKIFDKLGIKKLFIAGSACMIISNVGMYFITLNTPVYIAALYNVVRCVAIGCLMMPLVTWGTANAGKNKVADATAMLISLRTTAGAVGSAIFVGIMTFAAGRSAAVYGENAEMHGLNIAFIFMSFVTMIMFAIAVFMVKENKEI